MFINQNISLRRVVNAMVFVAVSLAELFVSCVQIEQNNEGEGYVSFNPLSVNVSVEGLELTKASVPAERFRGLVISLTLLSVRLTDALIIQRKVCLLTLLRFLSVLTRLMLSMELMNSIRRITQLQWIISR